MTKRAAEANQARLRALSAAAFGAAAAAWLAVEADNAVATWTEQLPVVIAAVGAGQFAAAGLANAYVSAIAGGPSDHPANPRGFAGVGSNGLPLGSVLFGPALTVITALRSGERPARALAAGRALLDLLVRTQVTDAGRIAAGAAMAGHPQIAGYERQVRLPACSRCIVLAGRLYRWNDGFRRHSRCDCTMRPVTSEQWRTQNLDNNPRALFDRMDRDEQDKRFGKAGAKAIRDGADLSQVVNARRGMKTANVGGRQVLATTTGTTRRAVAGQRLSERFGTAVVSQFERTSRTGGTETVRLRGSRAPRLMPETIYQVAEDRDHAIRLLRLHGYLL